MHTHTRKVYGQPFTTIIACIFILLGALSACGTNTSTTGSTATSTSATGSTSAPASIPTTQSEANVNGCPNNAAVTTQPPAATVTLKSSNSKVVARVKKGDTIEVDLIFGIVWRGPANAS